MIRLALLLAALPYVFALGMIAGVPVWIARKLWRVFR